VAVGTGVRRYLRFFPNDALMGIGESRPTFGYLVTSANEEDWRRAAVRYGDGLPALPSWVFGAYFPPELEAYVDPFSSAVPRRTRGAALAADA
jgi:hypothetical protein